MNLVFKKVLVKCTIHDEQGFTGQRAEVKMHILRKDSITPQQVLNLLRRNRYSYQPTPKLFMKVINISSL